ncbi:DUF5593 domain-containing protein [Nocardia transvalensis]|nr:DUF5593 domain-containing protein [Nocardia transvalensis]
MVETLSAIHTPSVIVDGSFRRRFANLNRVSIATSAAIARRLGPLVGRCLTTRRTEFDETRLPSGPMLRIVAVPVFGPTDHVFGVALWAGAPSERTPPPPPSGTIEWNADTGTCVASAALRRLLELPAGGTRTHTTLSVLMSCFDRWDDRAGFLALFDPNEPDHSWVGTATTRSPEGTRRILHIAARTSPAADAIRAIVCDMSTVESAPPPDCAAAALRHIPLTPGHAVGIIDLNTRLIHEWITADHDPLACWRHHPPQIHSDDARAIEDACVRLLAGTPRATAVFRVSLNNDWITVRAHWSLICHGTQPQALIEVTILPE